MGALSTVQSHTNLEPFVPDLRLSIISALSFFLACVRHGARSTKLKRGLVESQIFNLTNI